MTDADPWPQLMQFAFGHLRLSPDQFWSMTPIELECAIRFHVGSSQLPLERARLEDLVAQYPDK